MPHPIGQKKLDAYDSREVGEVIQSPINLEAWPNPKWLALDGRDMNRADVRELGYKTVNNALVFPVGVFTSTDRTLAASPSTATICSDATNFLAAGAAGTDALQASAEGVTWVTTTGGWAASTAFPSIINAGTRFIAAPSAGESQPHVIAINGTAANLVVKANWTATTGGTVTTLQKGLSYNPVTGVTVLIKDGGLATASGVFALSNDADTSWAAASGGSTMDRGGVAFSGLKHIIISTTLGNKYQTTTDGVTVVDAFFPFSFTAGDIASNGNGVVVISATGLYNGTLASSNGFVVTTDHGTTWRFVDYERSGLSGIVTFLSYANNKFIAQTATAISAEYALSVGGVSWFYEPISKRGKAGVPDAKRLAYKGGVYCGVLASGSAAALTATEDMSKFKLPMSAAVHFSVAGKFQLAAGAFYIKARSK